MATTAYVLDNAANKEDLLGIITNLDYKEFQLVSGLGTSTAEHVLHQWLKDTLDTVGANARVEGADATARTITNPTRLTNYCQILDKKIVVTGTEEASAKAGMGSRMAYETTKAMKAFKQDLEYALMRGTLACGNNSVARQMKGIMNYIATANTTAASGVSLTEARLNDLLQLVWDDGTEVNAIYAPMYMKRKISAFTANGSTKYTNTDDRRLVAAVDVYQSDAASMVKLFKHRYVTISGDNNYGLVGINEDMFKIAYLRKPNLKDLAVTGDSNSKQLLGEATLEVLHDDAGFAVTAML